MPHENGQWIMASDSGLNCMYLGQLAEGLKAADCIRDLSRAGSSPASIELFNARLVLNMTVPASLPGGQVSIQTIFKIMPFPTNPDGGHMALKATTIIDVEGDQPTREMIMELLASCKRLEEQEKANRSRLITTLKA